MNKFFLFLGVVISQIWAQETLSSTSSLRVHSRAWGLGVGYLTASGPYYRMWGDQWGLQLTALPYVSVHHSLWDYDVNAGITLMRSLWDGPVSRGSLGLHQSSVYSYMGLGLSWEQEQSTWTDADLHTQVNTGFYRRTGVGAGVALDYRMGHLGLNCGLGLMFAQLKHKQSLDVDVFDNTGIKPTGELSVFYGW